MSSDRLRAILDDAIEKFNAGDLEGYSDTLYAPHATLHFLPPDLPPGREGAMLFYSGFLAAFPDAQLVIDDLIEEGDRIGARFHLDMTHKDAFQGLPATGKRVRLDGITIMRFESGKVVERWSQSDFMGLMQQLSALPASAGA